MESSDYRVEDRLRIAEVLYIYCRAIDRIDMTLLATVFEADAMIDKGAGPFTVADFIADVSTRHPTVPRTSHMVNNHLIDFVGPDEAFVESWCLAVEQHPPHDAADATIDHVYRVRYADGFRKSAGIWRIANRTFIIDHVMSVPSNPVLLPPLDKRGQGVRGPGDRASVLRREALGH